MARKLTNIMVTGGAGFIGCNFIRFLLGNESGFAERVVNVDRLTYAGNLESLSDIEAEYGSSRYFFEKADICDRPEIERILKQYDIDTIVHFAAESHVDRSILGPETFIKTNVMGTFTLLDAARNFWQKPDGSMREDVLFHHISTDEVYGSLGATGAFSETTPYDPRSPYSASKASSDHIASAYSHTYGLPLTLSNCSNNYGPYQFPEKLIPLMIIRAMQGAKLPVYGDGLNVRDWLHVDDHCAAIDSIMRRGKLGEVYNVGGHNERSNIEVVRTILHALGRSEEQISYVADRKGHDRRYAIDPAKMERELGWKPITTFADGIQSTITWYREHETWWKDILSGTYQARNEKV